MYESSNLFKGKARYPPKWKALLPVGVVMIRLKPPRSLLQQDNDVRIRMKAVADIYKVFCQQIIALK